MAVVVFDADVLIGFLNGADGHHAPAIERVQRALALAERRVMSAVNYAEVIVGPSKRGITFVQRVDVMFQRFGIQVIAVDQVMARAAAQIRARTRLGLPDAFVLAVASREGVDGTEVRIESFDDRLLMVAASE